MSTDIYDQAPKLRLVTDDDPTDAESMVVEGEVLGPSVDTADVPLTLSWGSLTSTDRSRWAPIVPSWLGDGDLRRQTFGAIRGNSWYYLRFHAVRTPKYIAKVLIYAPRGGYRSASRLVFWARAEEGNWQLRQDAANRSDAYTWQDLNRTRSKEARGRWWAVGVSAVAGLVATSVAARTGVVPSPSWSVAGAVLLLLCARAGAPRDRPITDRVAPGRRFTRLTGEMVRNAVVSLRLPGLKEGGQIDFDQEIHRDGPGWLARFSLPPGVEAVDALERRAGMSSALRLPIDQVWMSAGPDHAGQVDLWVGYQPASQMRQPAWALAAPNAQASIFAEEVFGSDERHRPVSTTLFERSYLLGGQPGSGKTYAARALLTIALLDPTCELIVLEFKGTGDFLDLESLCSTYVVGVDDEAFDAGEAVMQWALAEAERRGKRILAARKRGEAPLGKITPELAARPGSGLHPVVIVIDEIHELFAARKNAADAAERAIKRLRALGIIFVVATQIPDKDSLPANFSRCVTNSWCLSVKGHMENDMILGTGAYKRGLTGTVYRPVHDAGWGVMTGGLTPQSVRSQFPETETFKAILARAVRLRRGQVIGGGDLPEPRDLLADLLAVSAANGQHWGPAAEALMRGWPHAYPTLTPDALSAMARKRGVTSTGVKIDGVNVNGYRRDDVRQLIEERDAAKASSSR